MQDRPDLIESELSGLAFDSLQQAFKAEHIDTMFRQPCPPTILNDDVHVFIDPAAGGPYSDYAIVSVTRQKGLITVILLLTHEHERLCHPHSRTMICQCTEHLFAFFVFIEAFTSLNTMVQSIGHIIRRLPFYYTKMSFLAHKIRHAHTLDELRV
jgi:hypothetical protein